MIPLRRFWTKLLLLLACAVAVSLYIHTAARRWMATGYGNRPELASLQRAIALDPGNAEYHDRAGRYLLFADNDAAAARTQFRSAVALNPHRGRYWMDLAGAYQSMDAVGDQSTAIQRALSAEPSNADIVWEAANFYLIQGDLARALPQFRELLWKAPWMEARALQTSWLATHDVNTVLDLLPPRPAVYIDFLHLLTEGEPDSERARSGQQVWAKMISLHGRLDPKLGFFYIDYLLQVRRPGEAAHAWQDLKIVDASFQAYLPSRNRIVNPSFEETLLNAGFDWRYRVQPHVSLAVDTLDFRSGTRSLSLAFDGQATGDPGVLQLIPVEPNAKYEFSAYVKSEEIYSANGPRLSIRDAYSGAPYLLTEELLGTRAWHEVRGEFQTGPATSLLTLSVVRIPNSTRIRGKLWLDDLQLLPR